MTLKTWCTSEHLRKACGGRTTLCHLCIYLETFFILLKIETKRKPAKAKIA